MLHSSCQGHSCAYNSLIVVSSPLEVVWILKFLLFHSTELKDSRHYFTISTKTYMVFVLLTSSLCHWVIIEQASFLCILAYDIFPHVLENIRSFFGASLNWLGSKLYPLPLSQRTSPPPLPVCCVTHFYPLADLVETVGMLNWRQVILCTLTESWTAHLGRTGGLLVSSGTVYELWSCRMESQVQQNGVRGGLGLGSSLSLSFPHLTVKYFSNVNSWPVLE